MTIYSSPSAEFKHEKHQIWGSSSLSISKGCFLKKKMETEKLQFLANINIKKWGASYGISSLSNVAAQ